MTDSHYPGQWSMCGSLCPYESVTPKPCSWGSLPRNAREQIGTTQFDEDDRYERDSIGSSQTGSTRIRLQERWRVIGTKNKATTTLHEFNEYMEEHARAEMTKAGNFEDLRAADTDVGGFKRVQVSQARFRL